MERANANVLAAQKTKALPNGAASSSTDAIDLGPLTDRGARPPMELEILAPALTAAQLPDDKTMTYKVESDSASNFASPKTLADAVLVQTGAGGAGAAAATARFAIPSDCERYVRVTATNSGTGDASGASMTVNLKV